MKKRTFVRRLLASTTAAVMLLSTVSAMAAFRDTAGHWAEKTLTEWQEQGLIDGYSDGSFQPDGTMTRAGFAKLMNRGLGFTDEAPISFTDVKEGDWFYTEIAKAVAAGYAQGSGGTFRPQQVITRAQAAAMIARAAGLSDNETRAEGFTDAASIPAWAKGSIGAVAEAGFMGGYADGTFRADGLITRAQAVVTLDRVRKDTQNMTIENAGTTLENKTVNGDLIIAESVGEGNVTLKNVTVLGSVIVKGGGANSIYLDGVRVGGTVQLQKENVHLCLMGDTALGRVEIGMPCRITQDSSFKGMMGTLVIDLKKTSDQKIQIEVPAKLVELLSRANVVLNADVETLQIDRDAEGAQLDVKRGTTVGELTADAKVKLIGSGTVASLVVSVNDVTVSGSLSVKKTETEDGAKAPTVSGGSSGGSGSSGSSGGSGGSGGSGSSGSSGGSGGSGSSGGSDGSGGSSGGSYTPVKRVVDAETVADVTVPYGTSEADAMSRFPGSVTLNVTEDGTADTVSAAVSWALDKAYNANPLADTVYTVIGTVTVPDGYTYDGTLTVTAVLTVEADPDTTIAGISEVTGLELPYGAVESNAQLPVKVTLTPAVPLSGNDALLANVTWTLDGEWVSPGVNTFTGTVDMPAGYYYHGETTATITTTVTVMESGVTPGTKLVVNHDPLPTTSIGYASTEELVLAAARPDLPTNTTLQCQDDSYIEVTVPANDWRFTYTPYYPNSVTDQTVSLSVNAALPMGYEDENGTIRVYCSVEIKKLDTAALERVLDEARVQLDTLTGSEAEALADSTKLYVAPNGTGVGNVSNGVNFIWEDQKIPLETAYTAAQNKLAGDTFVSQAECDQLAQELQEASDTFKTITPYVGTFYTDALLLEAVKNGNAVNPNYSSEFAYSTEMQPLRYNYTYWLYGNSGWTEPNSGVAVSIDWSFSGDGAQYLTFAPEGGRDHNNYMHSYGVKVTGQPDKPKKVTLTATVKRYDLDPNGTEVGKIDYTATVGAPIRVDTTATVAAPRLTSGNKENNISVQVPLTGAEYIIGVDTSRITAAENTTPTGEVPLATRAVSITAGKSCTVNSYGLSVPVTASCGFMGVTLAPTSPVDPDADPAYKIGNIPVTIQKGALTVDESGGWYVPDEDLTYAAKVWGCNPAVTVLTQPAEGSLYTVSVSMAYMYEIRAIEIVYKTSDDLPSGAADEVYVSFSRDDGKTDASVQDGIAYKGKNVTLTPGAYHIWVRVENDGMWLQGDILTVNDNSSSADDTP